MPDQPAPSYLESFVFCGLCFTPMKREGDSFVCAAGCPTDVQVSAMEALVWKEIGAFLSVPEGRKAAGAHLGQKLTASDVRRIFRDLDTFAEFFPLEEKRRFAEALLEKVDVMSPKSLHIHFRL